MPGLFRGGVQPLPVAAGQPCRAVSASGPSPISLEPMRASLIRISTRLKRRSDRLEARRRVHIGPGLAPVAQARRRVSGSPGTRSPPRRLMMVFGGSGPDRARRSILRIQDRLKRGGIKHLVCPALKLRAVRLGNPVRQRIGQGAEATPQKACQALCRALHFTLRQTLVGNSFNRSPCWSRVRHLTKQSQGLEQK